MVVCMQGSGHMWARRFFAGVVEVLDHVQDKVGLHARVASHSQRSIRLPQSLRSFAMTI